METPLGVVERAYKAWEDGDIVEALCALDPEVRLHREDGLPQRGEYVGRDAVAEVFREVMGDWMWLEVKPVRFSAVGPIVAVVGSYEGCGNATGFRFHDRFVHLWAMEGGRGVWVGAFRTPVEALRALDGQLGDLPAHLPKSTIVS